MDPALPDRGLPEGLTDGRAPVDHVIDQILPGVRRQALSIVLPPGWASLPVLASGMAVRLALTTPVGASPGVAVPGWRRSAWRAAGCGSTPLGGAWVAEWNTGQLGCYEPDTGEWSEWALPGAAPHAYAVYVDEAERVWLTDFGSNSIVLFEPETEEFTVFSLPATPSNVRQLLGRPGEVCGAESAADSLVVIRY